MFEQMNWTASRSLDPFRPPFSKLQEYLDNLRMHLDIGLCLLSELEQLRRNFWENHQEGEHKQDGPPGSGDQTQPQRRSADPRQDSASANDDKGPNHLSQIKDQYLPAKSRLGQQRPQDGHVMRSGDNHLDKGCKNETCCRWDKNEPNQQDETSQEELGQALGSPSNGHRRTCSAVWDRSTEDSSLL